ncbi:GTP-binding protein Rhes [Lepisosteus oculatus]|uniref:GTP-binding protein Rhes n=1 Tax=Lepisosteus oculatus TaxID=7918 RepID=UPI003712F226
MDFLTAERARFPMAGRAEALCSCVDRTGNDPPGVRLPLLAGGQAAVLLGNTGTCGGAAERRLDYKNSTQHPAAPGFKVPGNLGTISKTGMGIIKTVTSQWRHQERKARVVRSASTGNRYPSSDPFPCKRSPYGQLAAAALRAQLFPKLSEPDPRLELLRSVKPHNCRRIVVLGAPRVGKTSIVRRFLREGFEERYVPTAEDFHRKLYQIRGETYQLDILDASGERGFPAKRRLSILTGDIFLLVFSVDDRGSLEEVRSLAVEIVEAKTKLLKSKESVCVPTVICGNKIDLEPHRRADTRAEVCRALRGRAFFETSAKDGTNLEEMFRALAERGGLPTETGPSQHRKISIRSYQALRSARRGGKENRAGEAPYGAVYPLARRPSFSTDLRQVLGPSPIRKRSKTLEKCNIQ